MVLTCGNVYGNKAIDAIEQELEQLRPTLHLRGIDELKRFNKLREILKDLKQQEKDRETIRQWEEWINSLPCTDMNDESRQCEKFLI